MPLIVHILLQVVLTENVSHAKVRKIVVEPVVIQGYVATIRRVIRVVVKDAVLMAPWLPLDYVVMMGVAHQI